MLNLLERVLIFANFGKNTHSLSISTHFNYFLMNRSLYVKAAVTATWLIALSACVDDGYDLSNIDTTSRFRVDELVIPMNLDVITLNSVIEIDEKAKFRYTQHLMAANIML